MSRSIFLKETVLKWSSAFYALLKFHVSHIIKILFRKKIKTLFVNRPCRVPIFVTQILHKNYKQRVTNWMGKAVNFKICTCVQKMFLKFPFFKCVVAKVLLSFYSDLLFSDGIHMLQAVFNVVEVIALFCANWILFSTRVTLESEVTFEHQVIQSRTELLFCKFM